MDEDSSGGYSLEQLLEWCRHDRLIDGYDRLDDRIVVTYEGSEREYSLPDARSFLKGIFTASHRGSGADGQNLA